MSDLRLIILALGLALIAGIYLWEIVKQREQTRRQTVRHRAAEHDLAGIKLSARGSEDDDYSGAISDLNDFLARSKQHEDQVTAEKISIRVQQDDHASPDAGQNMAQREDVSAPYRLDGAADSGDKTAPTQAGVDDFQVMKIFLRAPDGLSFDRRALFEAVKQADMEYGEMDIFHFHKGGRGRSETPLFSLANMFEPGSFDPSAAGAGDDIKGVVMFFCLPAPEAGEFILERMLGSARYLAQQLGGEVLGPDRTPLDQRQLAYMQQQVIEFENRS